MLGPSPEKPLSCFCRPLFAHLITENYANFQNTSVPPQEHTVQKSLMADKGDKGPVGYQWWPVDYCWWLVGHPCPELPFAATESKQRQSSVFSKSVCTVALLIITQAQRRVTLGSQTINQAFSMHDGQRTKFVQV